MADNKYRLEEVKTPKQAKAFHDLGRMLYRNEKYWVCPLDEEVEKVFDPNKNKLFVDGDAVRWLALDEKGECVGRIAAFYNKEKSALEDQPTGGCGFFESIDDFEVARMLFDASKEWLEKRGMEAMDGPINFGQRDSWWGLLVEGFDYEALYENPYNFPYYEKFFDEYGFKNYFNQNTYHWIIEDDINKSVGERAARLHQDPGYTYNNINMKDLEGEAEKFRKIYNAAWSIFSGVKLMEKAEALRLMNMMKPIIDPEIIFFAYYNGEPIGFFINLPDLNRVIGKFNGKFGWWQKLRLMWDLKVAHSCDRMFGAIFAVSPEFRGKGVESGIMQTVVDRYLHTPKNKYKTLELAWVGDFNPVMNRMIETYVGAWRHKRHVTYRYLFDREKPFTRCPRIGFKKD